MVHSRIELDIALLLHPSGCLLEHQILWRRPVTLTLLQPHPPPVWQLEMRFEVEEDARRV